jgi:serine/threonine protein kinase
MSFSGPKDGGFFCELRGRFGDIIPISFGERSAIFKAVDIESQSEIVLKVQPFNQLKIQPDGDGIALYLIDRSVVLRLNHPSVVKTFAVELFRQDMILTVMEYVPGETLLAANYSGKLAGREMTTLVDLGRAVSYLHGLRLLHRDINLSNAIVDQAGHVKLIDVELICQLGQDDRGGNVRGTLLFVAPEMLFGQSATTSSDIYSYSVVCYFMLTGQYPRFPSDIAEMLERGRFVSPPTDIRELAPAVPAKVAAAVMRGLSDEPSARGPNIEAMLGDFENVV